MKRILLTITIVFALVISAGAQFNTNSKMVGHPVPWILDYLLRRMMSQAKRQACINLI